MNETKKASKHWQEYSSDKMVTNINPCIYKRFCDDFDLGTARRWCVAQHKVWQNKQRNSRDIFC